MGGYRNCRSAKTAEEYLLKCLFAAQEERDKAVFYAESLKIAEDKRIKEEEERVERLKEKIKNAPVFIVRETKTICFKVELSYMFIKADYKLNDVEILSDILKKNDKDLYEWASQSYTPIPGSYYGNLRPIELKKKTYDYVLSYMEDEDTKKTFVSKEWYPCDFIELKDHFSCVDDTYPIEMEEEIKKEAIKKLRVNLQDTINKLKSEQTNLSWTTVRDFLLTRENFYDILLFKIKNVEKRVQCIKEKWSISSILIQGICH